MILRKYKAWLWYILELYKNDLRYQEQVQLLWKICEGDVENSAKYEKRNSEIQKKKNKLEIRRLYRYLRRKVPTKLCKSCNFQERIAWYKSLLPNSLN